MATLSITAPGVEIREIDRSQRAVVPAGTDVLVLGFAARGPVEQVYEITDRETFETIYGLPRNAAERYFYYSVKGVLDGGGRAVVSRLPYGTNAGSNVSEKSSILWYPAIGVSNALTSAGNTFSQEVSGYIFGRPTLIELTTTQYTNLIQGNFTWQNLTSSGSYSSFSDIGKAGLIILNKRQTLIDGDFEGYYIGVNDSFSTAVNTDYNSITGVRYANVSGSSFQNIPDARIGFNYTTPVSGSGSNTSSISRDQENINIFPLADGQFIDSINIGVYALKKSPYNNTTETLTYELVEGITGSLYSQRSFWTQAGGTKQSFFLESVDDNSPYVQVFVNPNISTAPSSWMNSYGNPSKAVLFNHAQETNNIQNSQAAGYANTPALDLATLATSSLNTALAVATNAGVNKINELYPLNIRVDDSFATTSTQYQIGNVPAKIDRILQTLESTTDQNIDISVEGGLGTIYATTQSLAQTAYDDTLYVSDIGNPDTLTGFYKTDGNIGTTAQDVKDNYLAVYEKFRVFAEETRKDHIFVADPYKPFFVQGRAKVLDNKNYTFTQHIFTPSKNLYDTSSTSFAAVFPNWAKVVDIISNQPVYVPFSGIVAGIMSRNDINFNQWTAPAGYQYGKLVSEVVDLAIYPNQNNQGQFYKYSLNPISKFTGEGFVVFGQKTKLSTPSAFDRISVRRLFLFLEKVTQRTLQYFVFQPNTFYTRSQVVNTLTPIYESVKNSDGVYDYMIICDERNNTPEVIDQNQLVVDIYLKPVRTAEFIRVNFYASRTDANFSELV